MVGDPQSLPPQTVTHQSQNTSLNRQSSVGLLLNDRVKIFWQKCMQLKGIDILALSMSYFYFPCLMTLGLCEATIHIVSSTYRPPFSHSDWCRASTAENGR